MNEENKDLVERVTKVEVEVDGLKNFVIELRGDIREIKDKLLRRPSWLVSLVITTLVAIIISLVKFR